jgi:K+ transporter
METDFYDLVSETCVFDDAFASRLGFKKVFRLNSDIKAAGHGSENSNVSNQIAFGRQTSQLLPLVRHGARFVAITDSYIDKQLMQSIKDNGCILCMPMSIITASYGPERSRNTYRMKRLFEHARKMGIEVGFVSMAKTKEYMNSYMQLIELAKLIGADERYARYSLGEINKRMNGSD